MKTLTIIDTFGFFFRLFYATKPLRNSKNFPTGLLLGFCNLINNLYKDEKCDYLLFALEGGGQNLRKNIYPQYKQNRSEAPEDLIKQLPVAIEFISKMNLTNLSIEGYEADDIIATIATLAQKEDIHTRIISSDKDLYQLIDDGTYIYDPVKKIDIKDDECVKKFGVKPREFIDYQSLVGDSSDNIKGIKGIGDKTAQKLIAHFGSLENIYARQNELESVVTPRLANIIRESKEDAFLSKKLVTLFKDVPLDLDLKSCEKPAENPLLKITDLLQEYELTSVLQKIKGPKFVSSLNSENSESNAKKSASKSAFSNAFSESKSSKISEFNFAHQLLDSEKQLFEILDSVPLNAPIGFDTESDSLDVKSAKLVGFSFSIDGIAGYYVPINHSYLGVGAQVSESAAKKAIQKIYAHPIIGHNLKFDIALVFANLGIKPQNEILDSMILAWLKDPSKPVGLDKQMLNVFNHKMIAFEDVVKKNETFADVPLELAAKYAAEDAVATFALFQNLKSHFENSNPQILKIAHDLEFAFINVLVQMEAQGIEIDTDLFEKFNAELTKTLFELTNKIHELAGETFNIKSSQQLSEILFQKLGLESGRSVKGGLSTDENVLNNIRHAHPIIELILEYRETSKIKSTYIEPLLKYAKQNENHRIYTSFLQTGTVTGRLSSKSPNLQNIPVRTEFGRRVREGFIARDGYKLVSVDYSQIELRLLAHFSQDAHLIEAFKQDKDIHLETALRLFGQAQAQEKRFIAKSINFGLIYGMGAKKLSDTLGIALKDAREYVKNYFDLFPTIKNYLDSEKQKLLQNGYTQTLLGRRRYFDFQNALEVAKKDFVREGINCIFQGSAADLIKLSMLKIHENFTQDYEKFDDVRMLLQVHDELIFEIKDDVIQSSVSQIQSIMNSIYKLNVPLKCSVNIGINWALLK